MKKKLKLVVSAIFLSAILFGSVGSVSAAYCKEPCLERP